MCPSVEFSLDSKFIPVGLQIVAVGRAIATTPGSHAKGYCIPVGVPVMLLRSLQNAPPVFWRGHLRSARELLGESLCRAIRKTSL